MPSAAVDFGRKKTGVAVSVGGLAPRPLEVLQVEGNSPELLVALRSLAQREFVSVRPRPLCCM